MRGDQKTDDAGNQALKWAQSYEPKIGMALDRILEKFRKFISDSSWVYAKTMTDMPHEYIIRSSENEETFSAFAQFIRDYGYQAHFRDMEQVFTYYDLDGYRFWTMGNPLPETMILNRSRLDLYEKIETEDGILIK